MKKQLLLAGAAVLLAAACDKADEFGPAQAVQDKVIRLTLAGVDTRATNDNLNVSTVTAGNTVGAFGIATSGAITNGSNNPYTVGSNGDLTAAASDMLAEEGTSSVSIYAYAPYQSGWTACDQSHTFTVAADQSTDAGYLASDLLYATAAGTPGTTPIALNFGHKLARLKITLQRGADAEDLSAASVTVNNTKIETTFNPSTGAVGTAAGSTTDITAASALGSATVVTAIIVPQTVAAGTALVTIATSEKQLIAKLADGVTFAGGKSYNFTVQIGSNLPSGPTEVELQLGSTTVVGWDDEDLGGADSEEKEEKLEINLHTSLSAGGSGSWNGTDTYTWKATSDNLMTIYTVSSSEDLAKYKTLRFTLSDYNVDAVTESDRSQAGVRIGYGSSFSAFDGMSQIQKNGDFVVDITGLSDKLTSGTPIKFGGGGNKAAEWCSVKLTNVYFSSKAADAE